MLIQNFTLISWVGTGKLDAGTSISLLPCGLDASTDPAPDGGNLNRMLGGQKISARKYPWYVWHDIHINSFTGKTYGIHFVTRYVMVAKKRQLASGSIISNNYILTCKHCLPEYENGKL